MVGTGRQLRGRNEIQIKGKHKTNVYELYMNNTCRKTPVHQNHTMQTIKVTHRQTVINAKFVENIQHVKYIQMG